MPARAKIEGNESNDSESNNKVVGHKTKTMKYTKRLCSAEGN